MTYRSFRHAGLAVVLLPLLAPAQGTVSTSSEVRDAADMFGAEAVRKAIEQVVSIERKYRVPVTVETIDSLKGEPIGEAAIRYAKRLGPQGKGLFILLSKQDRRIEVIASKDYPELEPRARRTAIRDAFLDEFRKNDYDGGLSKGLEAVEKTLASIRSNPATPKPVDSPSMPEKGQSDSAPKVASEPSKPAEGVSVSKDDAGGLVVRQQVRLTLAGARRVAAGVEAKAKEYGYKVNIAVVDDGGHLIAFARMDGARPASAHTALTKAISAATFRQPTGPMPTGSPTPDTLLSLSLQNAAAATGGTFTTLLGGVPIVVDGQVIGAVGVGGGKGEQDAEVARAGVAAFLADLQESAKTPPTAAPPATAPAASASPK